MTAVPPMVNVLVGVAGLMTRSCAGTGGWVVTPGSGAPLTSLRLVIRTCALVMVLAELLVMVRRTVSSPGAPATPGT